MELFITTTWHIYIYIFFCSMAYLESKKSLLHTWGTSIRPQYHTRICQEVFVGIWITPNKSTAFTENKMVTAENKSYCCADSTPGFKSITVNKRKLNNKHAQRTQEFTWFDKLPTSTETTEKFHYKNREIQ